MKIIGAKIDSDLYEQLQQFNLSNTELVKQALRFYLRHHKEKGLTTEQQRVNVSKIEKPESSQLVSRYQRVNREVDSFLSDQSKKPVWEPVSKIVGDKDKNK